MLRDRYAVRGRLGRRGTRCPGRLFRKDRGQSRVPVVAQYPGGIRVMGDGLGVCFPGQASGDGESPGVVDGLAVRIAAVVFPEMHLGCFGGAVQMPPHGAHGMGQRAIEQNHLAGRETGLKNAGQDTIGDSRRPFKRAILINVAVVARGIADLRIHASAPQSSESAVLEEARAGAPHEVDVALDVAVAEVSLPVDLQGVLVAAQVNLGDDGMRVGAAAQNDGFSLTAAWRRRVVKRQMGDRQVVAVYGAEHAAAITAGHRTAIRVVQALVVGVGEDRVLAVLAHKREVVLMGEVDDLVVCTAAQEESRGHSVAGRDEVDGSLHCGEVAGAIGGDGDATPAPGRERGCGRFGGKPASSSRRRG
jgi:hypothetical protein